MPLAKQLEMAWCWALKLPTHTAVTMTELSNLTVIKWYGYFREVCGSHLARHPLQIGGQGIVVEVYAAPTSKGTKAAEKRWVFSGYSPAEKLGFAEVVGPRLDADSLLPAVTKFVRPGSVLHSNGMGAAMDAIAQPPLYEHVALNKFVDPSTGATTNNVKCFWKNCKRKFANMAGVHDSKLPGHLEEFVWRQTHGRSAKEAFDNLLSHIAEWYPTGQQPQPQQIETKTEPE